MISISLQSKSSRYETVYASLEALKEELTDNLDLIIGSVVMYRSKCGKNCTCNAGKKHETYYLSSKKNGKTKNLYIPKKAVEEARIMNSRHKRVKNILEEISSINYNILKEKNLTKGK